MRAIRHHGRLVALAGRQRVWLAPAIAALATGDPLKRHVAFMCLYSLELDEGRLPGPYSDEDAELFARAALGAATADPPQRLSGATSRRRRCRADRR